MISVYYIILLTTGKHKQHVTPFLYLHLVEIVNELKEIENRMMSASNPFY